jgi:hypothetical protein
MWARVWSLKSMAGSYIPEGFAVIHCTSLVGIIVEIIVERNTRARVMNDITLFH